MKFSLNFPKFRFCLTRKPKFIDGTSGKYQNYLASLTFFIWVVTIIVMLSAYWTTKTENLVEIDTFAITAVDAIRNSDMLGYVHVASISVFYPILTDIFIDILCGKSLFKLPTQNGILPFQDVIFHTIVMTIPPVFLFYIRFQVSGVFVLFTIINAIYLFSIVFISLRVANRIRHNASLIIGYMLFSISRVLISFRYSSNSNILKCISDYCSLSTLIIILFNLFWMIKSGFHYERSVDGTLKVFCTIEVAVYSFLLTNLLICGFCVLLIEFAFGAPSLDSMNEKYLVSLVLVNCFFSVLLLLIPKKLIILNEYTNQNVLLGAFS